MDPLAFLSWQFVMFSLFVATIMYVLRTVLESIFPKLATYQLLNSLFLMVLPVFIGAGLGDALKMYPYATGFTTTVTHVGYGAVAGLLSTILFKVIKELLVGKVTAIVGGALTAVGVTTTTTTVAAPQSPGPNDGPPSGFGGMGNTP